MFSLPIHNVHKTQRPKNQDTKKNIWKKGGHKIDDTVAIHQAKRGSDKKFGAEICFMNSLGQLTTLHAHLCLAKDTPHTSRPRNGGEAKGSSYKISCKKDDKQKRKPRTRFHTESMKRESGNSAQDFSESVRTDFIGTINKRYSSTIFVGGGPYSPLHAILNGLAAAVPAFPYDKIYKNILDSATSKKAP